MSGKPVRPREQANRDVEAVIDHYLDETSEKVAIGFVDELERAFARISINPGIGSSRYAHELDLPGLRFQALARYPYLVFYVEREDHIDVWRVLHGERDIPAGCKPDVSLRPVISVKARRAPVIPAGAAGARRRGMTISRSAQERPQQLLRLQKAVHAGVVEPDGHDAAGRAGSDIAIFAGSRGSIGVRGETSRTCSRNAPMARRRASLLAGPMTCTPPADPRG